MVDIYLLILMTLSVRFFIIDFKLLAPVWEVLKTYSDLIKTWHECAFCNGYWIGLAIGSVALYPNILFIIGFAIASGFLSFVFNLIMQALIKYINS